MYDMYDNKQKEGDKKFKLSDIVAMCLAILWIVIPYALGILAAIWVFFILFSVFFI
ncbi:MAG: hypothetical protein LRZ93_02750 [Clostridiales bacterium]|nr:hypothetical protein [Clostridiales bacterium]